MPPTKNKSMNTFLDKATVLNAPTFLTWKEHIKQANGKVSKKELRQYVREELAKLNCLADRNQYKWNMSVVEDILTNKKIEFSAIPGHTHKSDGCSNSNEGVSSAIMVDSPQKLLQISFHSHLRNCGASKDFAPKKIVAIDCEGVPENLFLVQIATPDVTYILDCVKLGVKTVCDSLCPLLQDGSIVKYFHDLHNDVAAFSLLGGIHSYSGTFDTQLACECKTGHYHMGFNGMLELFGQPTHPTKHSMKRRIEGGSIFGQRPLAPEIIAYAADDVKLLVAAHESIKKSLGEEKWMSIQAASDARANAACKGGRERQICFDAANRCAIASIELLNALRPRDILVATPLEVSDDTSTVLSMLPKDLQKEHDGNTHNLFEIV
jgi:hypothetical protein